MTIIQQIVSSRKGNAIVVFTIAFLVWSPFFFSYWAQDDFWIVTNSRTFTPEKFSSGTNGGFLRPVSTFWYPFTLQAIFGENPFVYHLINGIISGFTSVVVYFIAYQLVKNKHVSLIAGIIYGTHFIHMFEQSWFAGAQDILASFFFATSVLFFLIGIERKNKLYYAISIVTSALAILSKESTIILPMIFLFYLIILRYSLKKIILYIIPFLSVMLIFGLMWFSLRHIAENGAYQLFFDFSIIKNLSVYIYWLAFPILIVVKSLFGQTSDYFLFRSVGNYTEIMFTLLAAIFIPIYIKKISNIQITNKRVIHFSFISGFISIGPAIFVTNHLYSYYLDYALISFSIFIAILAKHLIKKLNIKLYFQIILFASLMILIQYSIFESINHASFNNPLPQESKDSKQYSQLVNQSLNSVLGPKDIIYVINYSQYEYRGVMASGSLFNYLFPNSDIHVIPLNNTQQVSKNCDSKCVILIKGHELYPIIITKNQ